MNEFWSYSPWLQLTLASFRSSRLFTTLLLWPLQWRFVVCDIVNLSDLLFAIFSFQRHMARFMGCSLSLVNQVLLLLRTSLERRDIRFVVWRMCALLEVMELLPLVTWFGLRVTAVTVALEAYVTQQPSPRMDLLAALPPLRSEARITSSLHLWRNHPVWKWMDTIHTEVR